MAAENTSPKKNFYSLRENRFRFFVNEKTDTSKEIKNDAGDKVYHYEEFNNISGYLRRIMTWAEESKKESGKTWDMFAIDLRDKDNNLECIQCYKDSNFTTSFLKRLPNVDLTKEIFITVRTDDKGYDRADVYQKDEQGELKIVPFFWTKDKPLPNWTVLNQDAITKAEKAKKAAPKKIWDRTEQNELLEKLMNAKNAEIADIIKATQKDGIKPEDLVYTESEFGKVLVYTAPAETPEEKHKREVAELDEQNTIKESDLPF